MSSFGDIITPLLCIDDKAIDGRDDNQLSTSFNPISTNHQQDEVVASFPCGLGTRLDEVAYLSNAQHMFLTMGRCFG